MLEESTNLKIVESSENHPLKIEFNVEENDYEKKLVKYNDLVIQINKTDLNKTNINKLKNTSTVDIDFFDDEGNYKISEFLEKAYKSSLPNKFESDFIETDRKVNLLFSAFEGKVLRIFPIPNNSTNKWVSFSDIEPNDFSDYS